MDLEVSSSLIKAIHLDLGIPVKNYKSQRNIGETIFRNGTNTLFYN
jgi:hypothetical protein